MIFLTLKEGVTIDLLSHKEEPRVDMHFGPYFEIFFRPEDSSLHGKIHGLEEPRQIVTWHAIRKVWILYWPNEPQKWHTFRRFVIVEE
jgi:hypothetical protein